MKVTYSVAMLRQEAKPLMLFRSVILLNDTADP
jgi:hypothetical protein